MINILSGSVFLIALVCLLTALVIGARAFLMPHRLVHISVNDQKTIDAMTGQKLLTALNDNGVLVPSACAGAGTCGLCRVRIAEGAPEALPIETARLTRAELREGTRLACQVTMRNNMAVDVAEDLLGAEALVLPVASTRQLTPLIREVVLQLPEDERPEITAGAFIQVTAPPFTLEYADIPVRNAFENAWLPLRDLRVATQSEVTRAYSISNRPEDSAAGRLVLNIRLALPPPSVKDAPPGVVSSWLFSLCEGDPVKVSGPFGTFRAMDTDREMVFIGGGVGMAPLRAMIFDQLEGRAATRKMTFWYGARSVADLFYVEEFDALAAAHQNFDWTVALSDPAPDDNWTGAVGFVHTVALQNYLGQHPAPEDCEYYLCGPPLMIRAVLSMLDELGVDEDNIHNDDFGV